MRAPVVESSANSRRVRRGLARALLVFAGTIVGTAAAWAISSASASAETMGQPDVPAVTSHAGHGDLAELLGGRITDQLPKTTAELGSSAMRAVDPAVKETSDGLRDVVRVPSSPSKPSKPATGGELGKIVDGVHGVLDTVDHKVDTDVLAPITRPIQQEPAGRYDTPGAGIRSDMPSTTASHEPGATSKTGADSRSPQPTDQPVQRTQESVPRLPAGGLSSAPDGPLPGSPLRDYPGAPPAVPSPAGSTGHDGGSSNPHTSVADDRSDVPILAGPALLASLLPAAHQVRLHLAAAPGTTPD